MKRGTSLVGLAGLVDWRRRPRACRRPVVSETLGEVGPARTQGMVRKRRRPAPARTGQLARLVRQALQPDPALAPSRSTPWRCRRGTVELQAG